MQHIITRLQQLAAQMPERLHQFSAEELAHKPAPGKWSKKEILGHLCDSALHNWQRFYYAQLAQGTYSFQRYPQDDLVLLNQYQSLPAGQIASLWASLNRQIVAVLENLPSAKWEQPVQLPNGGEQVTLQWLIEDYLLHLEHHLGQIFPYPYAHVPALPVNWKISVEEALAALSNEPDGKLFRTVLERRNLEVEIYAPQKTDLQKPHEQDELYVVISGSGMFFNDGERRPFQPGDVIFVPAGVEHRFESFTDEFKTWVIFYG